MESSAWVGYVAHPSTEGQDWSGGPRTPVDHLVLVVGNIAGGVNSLVRRLEVIMSGPRSISLQISPAWVSGPQPCSCCTTKYLQQEPDLNTWRQSFWLINEDYHCYQRYYRWYLLFTSGNNQCLFHFIARTSTLSQTQLWNAIRSSLYLRAETNWGFQLIAQSWLGISLGFRDHCTYQAAKPPNKPHRLEIQESYRSEADV